MDVVDTVFHVIVYVCTCSFFLGHVAVIKENKRETGNDELPLSVTFREL